jgi:putative transcriptional regulator
MMLLMDNGNSTLAPTLLISMPQLNDPNFSRAVVLLCEYGPEGAFGLVVNRPTDTAASEVVQLEPPLARDNGLELWIGGPVEPQRGWILVGEDPDDSSAHKLCEGIYLSSSPLLLRQILESVKRPRARLLTGYAGWGPGQLDQELAASAWLIADIDLELIFDTRSDLIWEMAIRRLGADPSALQMGHGVH